MRPRRNQTVSADAERDISLRLRFTEQRLLRKGRTVNPAHSWLESLLEAGCDPLSKSLGHPRLKRLGVLLDVEPPKST